MVQKLARYALAVQCGSTSVKDLPRRNVAFVFSSLL